VVTPEQIAVVERTVLAADPVLDAIAADFYRRLFAADPALEELFTTDWVVQRARFVAHLKDIMLAIRDHDRFLQQARALGARHVAYQVRAAHYRLVGTALLAALGAQLGPAWTPEVAEAFRLAYNLTAEVMMAGAADAVRAP
jgi:hemoglobin-like flavoprotein